MSIKQITPMSAVDSFLKKQLEKRVQAIIGRIAYVGESSINEARVSGTYMDRTGNLRSSIGYVIVKDGKVIGKQGFGGKEGKQSEAFALQTAKSFPKGIVLIVVAGMSYARYVSAMGYDVLDSAQLLAEKLVPVIMKQLGFEVK
jgi:hypothetical protein